MDIWMLNFADVLNQYRLLLRGRNRSEDLINYVVRIYIFQRD